MVTPWTLSTGTAGLCTVLIGPTNTARPSASTGRPPGNTFTGTTTAREETRRSHSHSYPVTVGEHPRPERRTKSAARSSEFDINVIDAGLGCCVPSPVGLYGVEAAVAVAHHGGGDSEARRVASGAGGKHEVAAAAADNDRV